MYVHELLKFGIDKRVVNDSLSVFLCLNYVLSNTMVCLDNQFIKYLNK